MENYYPYSDEEMQNFHQTNKFNDTFKSYLWHRSRWNFNNKAGRMTQEEIDSIALHCEILYFTMLDLDRKKTLLEVPDLADI